ncbi:MAG: hypothetical protein M1834_004709 [Cirrosporium novae-zelandiae]|nr:MAG: hypothetical protein M1834_004709 [Cirrosporium novae-zelandiae]
MKPTMLNAGARLFGPAFRTSPRIFETTSRFRTPIPPIRPQTTFQPISQRSFSKSSFSSQSRPFVRPRSPKQRLQQPAQRRWAYYYRFDGGGPQGGGRKTRFEYLIYKWKTSKPFRIGVYTVGGGGLAFYVSNLEEVPVSGRKRFNCIGEGTEEEGGRQMYDQVLRDFRNQLLPSWDSRSRQVQRVLNRLVPASGLQNVKWEVHVIDNPGERNAFVLPGGKVFVFSGILQITRTDSGLAAVLGHEIAHNVAHHAAERMSRGFVLFGASVVLASILGVDANISSTLLNFIFMLPHSRTQETEADYIGLLMMAKACYDPSEAMGVWERMGEAEQRTGGAPPQFLSTHPSSHNRRDKIREWLPEAEMEKERSNCGPTNEFSMGWNKTFGDQSWFW